MYLNENVECKSLLRTGSYEPNDRAKYELKQPCQGVDDHAFEQRHHVLSITQLVSIAFHIIPCIAQRPIQWRM